MSEEKPRRNGPVPVFLFSLPRSGSTLLQRILATHPEVATGPEPTFLLPMLHIGSDTDVFATFDQRFTAMAVEDFLTSTGAGRDTFDAMVRAAAYSRATSDDARYFLDKTPKYHMIAGDIMRIFPDSPAVVLWRNPLAVTASLMSTWRRRRSMEPATLPTRPLPRAAEAHRYRVRESGALPRDRYEDLVADTNGSAAALFDHMDLDVADSDIERFSEVELVGRIQDPNVGKEGFTSVRSDRVAQWTTILSNPIRKRWCRRYLQWLGAERMAVMGYDLGNTLRELDGITTSRRFLASDVLLVPYDTVYRVCEVGIFAKKLRLFRNGERRLLAHK